MQYTKQLTQRFLYILGGLLIVASVLGNGLNFLYNAYLGRVLSVETFGILSLIGGIVSLADILFNSLSRTVTYQSAFILGRYKKTIKEYLRSIRKHSLLFSIFVTLVWIICIPFMAKFFVMDSYLPLILFIPVWPIGIGLAVDSGYLSGNLKFAVLALMTIVESFSKLVFAFIFLQFGLQDFIYAALPLSMLCSLTIAWLAVIHQKHVPLPKSQSALLKFPKKFFVTSIFIKISAVAYLNLDLVLAKHFLSSFEAGEYALLSLSGKMIFMAGTLFSQFILPIISKEEGAGRESSKVFNKLLLATAAICFIGFIFVGIFGSITIPLLLGERTRPILRYLPLYTLAMVFFTLGNSIVTYHQIKKRHLFPIASVLIAGIQILGIIIFHKNVGSIVWVMTTVGFVFFICMYLLHIWYGRITLYAKNIQDFAGLFMPIPQQKTKQRNALRMLIFNWRDTKHVWSGGAEIYIHELAKKWVRDGNIVTVFCGNDGHNPRYEIVDGVQIVRRGGFYTVYFWAFLYYVIKFRNRFDVIIDSENGIPFFTPLYSRVPVFLLIHHIHQEVFRNHLRWPFSMIASFIEQRLMPLAYFNKKIITVSDSSKTEIEKIGLGKRSDITIIHPGIDIQSFVPSKKTEYPSLVYLGRLKPYKNVDIIIKAFAAIVKKYPSAQLFIIGDGEGYYKLTALAKALRISQKVKFLGQVSEKKKRILLARSWLMLQPSQIEGWGITVIEANASRTPVIASNVNGLRDSVINGRTGLLVHVGHIKAFTQSIDLLFSRPAYRRMLEREAYIWAKNFSWEKSAEDFLKVVNKVVIFENKNQKHILAIKGRMVQTYGK